MVTITDIATKAGVSRATVSYVLNERNTTVRISDHTRQRVMETAAELGYRRNELARAVITGKNRMLGFWVMHSNREPVVRVLGGAMKEADSNDYFIKMLGLDNDTVDSRIVERCIEWRLSGIIAIHAPAAAMDVLYPKVVDSGIPMVVVDSQRPPQGSTHVAANGAGGVRSVVEYLVKLGHRKIVFIAGEPDEDTISHTWAQAYLNTMQELGLQRYQKVLHGYWLPEPTEHITRTLLQQPTQVEERPTAIVCASDNMAMVVVRTAGQMSIRVPQELSVTGFDDSTVAALYNPPLTTVAQPFEEMGRLAVRSLLASTDVEQQSELLEYSLEQLPTQLVVRQSTAAPFTGPDK
ncbi:MAG TPA: LacI family DNA-binding transcriptional regulator [Abditibacteriaceae bacterium]|jgi:DNA-binding LacI/PurR family transcriptional regulator